MEATCSFVCELNRQCLIGLQNFEGDWSIISYANEVLKSL